MAQSNTVKFEVAPSINYVYESTAVDDLVIYTSSSNQRLLFGTGSNTKASLVVTSNNIGIGKSNPAYALDVNGVVNASSLYVGGAPYIGSQFANSNNIVYLMGSNVGIGISNPEYKFQVEGDIAVKGNINIQNYLAMRGLALMKRSSNLANITTVSVPGWNATATGTSISSSNFIGFQNSNNTEYARFTPQGRLGINTSNPQALIEAFNFARFPRESLTWTQSNITTYTALSDTYSNLSPFVIKASSARAANAFPVNRAFDASSNQYISADSVYTSGLPNGTYLTNVSGSNYPGEWIEFASPYAINLSRLYVLANVNSFVLAASSNTGSTWSLVYYTQSNLTNQYNFHTITTSNNLFSTYRLIATKLISTDSNLAMTNLKLYGNIGPAAASLISDNTIHVNNGTLNVTGRFEAVPDTMAMTRSNGPFEYPPAAMTDSNTTITGQFHGNGPYSAKSSTNAAGKQGWKAFDKDSNTTWSTSTNTYNASTGIYTANTYNTQLASGSTVTGEWVQMKFPGSVILSSMAIKPVSGTTTYNSTSYAWAALRSPSSFALLGSEDESAWYMVSSHSNITDWDVSGQAAVKTFAISQTQNAYKYYRLTIQAVGQAFSGVGASEAFAEIAELTLNGNLPAMATFDDDGCVFNSTNVGINTTRPQNPLDIIGNARIIGNISVSNISLSNFGNVTIYTSNNYIGIGKSNPGYALEVIGDIYASGNIAAFSDCNYKTNLVYISNALEKINTLSGYTYNFINDPTPAPTRYAGLLAQDVIEVLPEVVMQAEDAKLSISYGNMMGLVVNAIKELKESVDDIKQRLSRAGI